MKTFKITKTAFTLFLLLSFGALFNSCKNHNNKTSLPDFDGIILADETLKPILDAELLVYKSFYPDYKINIIYKTETDALNKFLKDSVWLIFTSRPLKKEERDNQFARKGYYPVEYRIARDGVALITNRENKDTLLSIINLRKILSGDITRWNQINPKYKSEPVKIVFDNRNSSTVRFILDSIMGGKDISNHNAALETNQNVLDYILQNKDAIGVIGVSWISDHRDSALRSFLKKVNVMALSRDSIATEDNSYQPYQYYLMEGQYPLTRDIYFISSDPRNGVCTHFSNFVSSNKGQLIILKNGILPSQTIKREIKINQDF